MAMPRGQSHGLRASHEWYRTMSLLCVQGQKKARRPAAGIYAPRVRADPTATLACDAQHTPLDRRCSERTASGILPH